MSKVLKSTYGPLISKIREFGALRIHCWGGLGSQLFAVALYIQLQNQYPRRKVILCMHEGGVTKRESEITGLFSNLSIEEIEDFSNVVGLASANTETNAWNPRRSIKNSLKLLLIKLSFLATLDDVTVNDALKPWTIAIRGHYSYRKLEKNAIENLLAALTQDGVMRFKTESDFYPGIGVHFRLGDLLNLPTKKPLDSMRVANGIAMAQTASAIKRVSVFSDSPNQACSLLQSQMDGMEIIGYDRPTWETIGILSHTSRFIGTFSKVSLWIVIFRYYSPKSLPSYMPIESKDNLELLLGSPLDSSRISFYD